MTSWSHMGWNEDSENLSAQWSFFQLSLVMKLQAHKNALFARHLLPPCLLVEPQFFYDTAKEDV